MSSTDGFRYYLMRHWELDGWMCYRADSITRLARAMELHCTNNFRCQDKWAVFLKDYAKKNAFIFPSESRSMSARVGLVWCIFDGKLYKANTRTGEHTPWELWKMDKHHERQKGLPEEMDALINKYGLMHCLNAFVAKQKEML